MIGDVLRERRLTLAAAESCTGGLVSHLITNVPGASDYFLGGVVSYSNTIKQDLLGVKAETLDRFGAVSAETVLEMAGGARRRLGADIAVAVTGIAGPGGATADKPVGLTFIGVCDQSGQTARRFLWDADRETNKRYSAQAALEFLLEYLTRSAP